MKILTEIYTEFCYFGFILTFLTGSWGFYLSYYAVDVVISLCIVACSIRGAMQLYSGNY